MQFDQSIMDSSIEVSAIAFTIDFRDTENENG